MRTIRVKGDDLSRVLRNLAQPGADQRIADKLENVKQMVEERKAEKQRLKEHVARAREAGFKFSVCGDHTICWKRVHNVWTFAVSIRNPNDKADKYTGKSIAYSRYVAGERTVVKLLNGVTIKDFFTYLTW